ncbi:nitric oxide reductase activation protein NorD [Mycobacterium basiliense]|uniref:nitric oxide reductase activation protein NorD n=1 Tax=Mycobacterium basiliense TaxID=2094119 RepID=UPI001E43CEF1|nr:VWA domain-containing protein [Mycobacterium basiliense]
MTSEQQSPERLPRWGVLASAIAGRGLHVALSAPGEPSWTDGDTIFVATGMPAGLQLQSLAVQASLLAAGSLERDVLRALRWRTSLARRYLAVEGQRALAVTDEWLPPRLRAMIDVRVVACSDSPTTSLAVALSRRPIADPPRSFGAIRPRKMLAQLAKRTRGDTQPAIGDLVERGHQAGTQLDDDTADRAAGADIVSSPIGGGGALGRLLRRMLGPAGRLGVGGQPGADAPTHRTRAGSRGFGALWSSPPVRLPEDRAALGAVATPVFSYPEWDVYRRRYRSNWCTVREISPIVEDALSPDGLGGYGLRRSLARIGLAPDWFRRQPQGEDIDIDAAIEAHVAVAAGSPPGEAIYVDRLRRRRDLAALLLVDSSGSVGQTGAWGKTVHEQQLAAAVALAVALRDLGDRLALYAFYSQGRAAVQLMPLKRFGEALDAPALRRIGGLVPGAYSRLGAAIRHGAAMLESQGGTTRRMLVVLSDGLAYDHGYERDYGAADARRALAEARGRGIGCVCLTVGASTDPQELQRVFGSAALATVGRPEQLRQVVGPLFRVALRSAEVRKPEVVPG